MLERGRGLRLSSRLPQPVRLQAIRNREGYTFNYVITVPKLVVATLNLKPHDTLFVHHLRFLDLDFIVYSRVPVENLDELIKTKVLQEAGRCDPEALVSLASINTLNLEELNELRSKLLTAAYKLQNHIIALEKRMLGPPPSGAKNKQSGE